MKELVQILKQSQNSSIQINKVEGTWFETNWHCNTEFQIILFTEGSGQVYTEIDMQYFEAGDTCIISSNISHKFQQTGDQSIQAIVLQFSDYNLSSQFMNLLQAANLHQGKNNAINRIFSFTQNHFQDPITLHLAAATVCMSVPSFCFYFKRCTHKTYFDYLNEVRVNYACHQLLETNKPVAAICYESGYNTIAHFHRQFLKLKKITPLQYRKSLLPTKRTITIKIPTQVI